MKKSLLYLLFSSLFITNVFAQRSFSSAELAQINKLKAKIEANPASLEIHQAFISAYKNGIDNPDLEEQYKRWMKKFPKTYAIPFSIGNAYFEEENPKAAFFLNQAALLKPDDAQVWELLANNAAFTHDIATQQECLKKAVKYAPTNPNYALNYAYFFKDKNSVQYDSLSLDVARRFPDSEVGTQALYLLALNAMVLEQKTAYYRQLYNRKSSQLSNSYLSAMTSYFDLLINTNPEKAFDLSLSLVLEGKRNRNLWNDKIKVAGAFLKARHLLIQNEPKQALATLNQVNLGSLERGNYIDAKETLTIFKAEAADAGKNTQIAYDSLAEYYSKSPTEIVHKALYHYGSKLKLDSNVIAKGISIIRENRATQATDFHLANYLSPGTSSLSEYSGKVILLTYWFPGCSPCRAEFPHFESVLKRINSKDVVYLGLNLEPSQDEYVLPFLRETGYSFTPLHDDKKRDKGNLEAPGAPVSYLIDQKGKIIFSNFRIDAENERTLELMISELLAVK